MTAEEDILEIIKMKGSSSIGHFRNITQLLLFKTVKVWTNETRCYETTL